MSCCQWPWGQASPITVDCINVPNNCNTSNICESLLLAFPGTATCAQAMDALGKSIGKRLGARVLLSQSGLTVYTFSIEKNRKRSTLSVSTAAQCSFPVNTTLVVNCASTFTAQLGTVDQLLNWVVENMK